MDLSGVRTHRPRTLDADDARSAAVLVGVLGALEIDPRLLFIRKADDAGRHAGEMGFPGGGHEPVDADLEATALREANEEVGLRADEAIVFGRLDDLLTVTDYVVRPYVARIADRRYVPDGIEAVEAVALPVAALIDPTNHAIERREHPRHGTVQLHFFRVDGYTVWGATGQMLAEFLTLTTDWEPSEGTVRRRPTGAGAMTDGDGDADADLDLPE